MMSQRGGLIARQCSIGSPVLSGGALSRSATRLESEVEASGPPSSGGGVSSQGGIGNVILAAFGQVSAHHHGEVSAGPSFSARVGQNRFSPSGLGNEGSGRGYHSSLLHYRRGAERQRRRSDQDVE